MKIFTPIRAAFGTRSARPILGASVAVALLLGGTAVTGPPASATTGGAISGHVSGNQGDPVVVSLLHPLDGAPIRTTLIDENGDYEFTQVAAGDYLVGFAVQNVVPTLTAASDELSDGSHDRATAEAVVVTDQPVTGIDATLDERRLITGAVTSDWSPVAGAFVVAIATDDTPTQEPVWTTLTNYAGGFILGPLDLGTYEITVDRDLDGIVEETISDVVVGPSGSTSVPEIDVQYPSGVPTWPTSVDVSPGRGTAAVRFGLPEWGTADWVQVAVWPRPGKVELDTWALTAAVTGTVNGTTNRVAVAYGNAAGLGKARVRDFTPGGCAYTWFTDVAASSPFCSDIRWMALTGISTGYDDFTFQPTASVSRQSFAAFLYRAAGSPNGSNPGCVDSPFSDVPTSHQFCGEIAWLVDQGITSGYSDGSFGTTRAVGRQAMAKFLHSFVAPEDDATCAGTVFADVSASNQFCADIEWMNATGISTGYEGGTYRPAALVTRQGMSTFLHGVDEIAPLPGAAPVGALLGPSAFSLDGGPSSVAAEPEAAASPSLFGGRPSDPPRPTVVRIPITD